jgi:hypothetical protein
MITQPAVPATGTASTNTVTNNTGNTAYVTISANGATMSNYYVNGTSVATTASIYTATLTPGSYISLAYTVAVPVWYWSPFTPAVPASGTPVANPTGQDVSVVLLGGTVTHVTVNGTDRATSSPANVMLPAGESVTLTYSGAPVWAWMNFLDLATGDSLGTAYAQADTILATGASGYNPASALPYAQHAATGESGFGTGVSN